MKKIVFSLVVLAMGTQAYAQDILFEARVKTEAMPAVLLESVTRDFPGYAISEVAALPLEVVEDEVILDQYADPSEYETFRITLKGRDRELFAMYDHNGKLLNSFESLRDVAPPEAVRNTIARLFPGWTLSKDYYRMVHNGNHMPQERYKLILTRGRDKVKVYTDAEGDVLKVS